MTVSMIDKRLFLALPVFALLAACGGESTHEGQAATGEVLQGTISDAMLPVDRVRSEAPLEDPEAFVAAQAKADAAAPQDAEPDAEAEAAEAEPVEGAADEPVAEEPAHEAE